MTIDPLKDFTLPVVIPLVSSLVTALVLTLFERLKKFIGLSATEKGLEAVNSTEDPRPYISRWKWWFLLYPTVRRSPYFPTPREFRWFLPPRLHQIRYGPKWQWTARLGFYSAVVVFLVLAGLTLTLMMRPDRPLSSYARNIAVLVPYAVVALMWRIVIHGLEGPLPATNRKEKSFLDI